MSDETTKGPGTIGGVDLTVPDAKEIRDFYAEVVGREASPVDMGGCSDFTMRVPGTETPAAGICPARGTNAGLPAQWLMDISVRDLDASVVRCRDRGGRIPAGPGSMGSYGRHAVIRDPAGAVAAILQPAG